MIYWAKINEDSDVTEISSEEIQPGLDWIKFDENIYTGIIPFLGCHYYDYLGCFVPPKMFKSWVLNESRLDWDPPFMYPDDDKMYVWNEDINGWVLINF
jgi:hypothetical protein